jgi:phosphopantothenoylcysteine decarboxylase/phosphopantothenate--cysteine ligase
MHGSLYDNPVLQRNLQQAKEYGLSIIPPRISEGKAKIPRIDVLVRTIIDEYKKRGEAA